MKLFSLPPMAGLAMVLMAPTASAQQCVQTGATLPSCATAFLPQFPNGCTDVNPLVTQLISSCDHPGCNPSFIRGSCPSQNHQLSCLGVPTPCNQITGVSDCSRANGCTWQAAPPPPPPPSTGRCTGGGIQTCSLGFSPSTCSACSNFNCDTVYDSCKSDCSSANPGCSCKVDYGNCNAGFGTGVHRFQCQGTPLRCAQITGQASCNRALNCNWVTTPVLPPSPEPPVNPIPIGQEGSCVGNTVPSTCNNLFPPSNYNSCLSSPPSNILASCATLCNQPGCSCTIDQGQCFVNLPFGQTPSTLKCDGTRLQCSQITDVQDCIRASHCTFVPATRQPTPVPTLQIIGEPTPAPVPGSCDVQVDLECKTPDDLACSTAKPVTDFRCQTGRIFSLSMSYEGSNCLRDSNQQGSYSTCSDVGDTSVSAVPRVRVGCANEADLTHEMTVEPNEVSRGESFTITNSRVGQLPAKIACALQDVTNDEIVQAVVFATSGRIQLDLKDRYGALEVQGCDGKVCSELWTYRTKVTNTGFRPAEVRELDLTLDVDGRDIDLLPNLDSNIFPIGSSATVDVTRIVDLCDLGENGGTSSALAFPQGSSFTGSCTSEKTIDLPNTPACDLEVSLFCTGSDSGIDRLDCRRITRENQLRCSCRSGGCAGSRELRFRYEPARCGASSSIFQCRDIPNLAPPAGGARVVFKQGLTELLDTTVETGKDLVFRNSIGNCLPDVFQVYILNPRTNQVTQSFTLNTRCSTPNQGIDLMQSFGALRFTGYSCSTQNVHNCFPNATVTACAENDSTFEKQLRNYDLVLNGEMNNLLESNQVLYPGGRNCESVVTEVSRCAPSPFRFHSTVSASTSTPCTGAQTSFEELKFSVGAAPPVPAPTRAPTANIDPEQPVPPQPSPTPPSGSCQRPVFATGPPPPGC